MPLKRVSQWRLRLRKKILKTLVSLGGDRRVSVEELVDIVECKPETILY